MLNAQIYRMMIERWIIWIFTVAILEKRLSSFQLSIPFIGADDTFVWMGQLALEVHNCNCHMIFFDINTIIMTQLMVSSAIPRWTMSALTILSETN